MARLLDRDDPEVQAAIGAARDILTRLGARPFLALLDAAPAAAAAPAGERSPLAAPEDARTGIAPAS
jgi:hypothetical protein